MGSLSNFLEDILLNSTFNNTTFTPAATVHVALCLADPTDAGTGASMSEVPNANGYTRKPVTFGIAASRRVTQSVAVTFDQATGAWGGSNITHWALVSSATHGAGDMYAYGNFTVGFSPVAGNTPTIPSGQLIVEISATAAGAGFTDYLVHSWLNRAFRNQAFPKPATYVGLATEVLTDTDIAIGTITEVSGNGYLRAQVFPNGAGGPPNWTLASGGAGAITNTGTILFPTPTGSWGNVQSCFLIDSASAAGNVLGYDSQNIADQTPVLNDTVQFAANDFDLSLS